MIELEKEAAAVKEQRAFLIGFLEPDQDRSVVESQLDELADLVRNQEIIPLEPEIVRLRNHQVRYRTGSGKAEELARMVQECEADILVFDVLGATNGSAFISRFIIIARSYTLSDIANVESSLFAVPTNHIFGGSFMHPFSNCTGSSSHTSDTTVSSLSSAFGNSSNERNSAK